MASVEQPSTTPGRRPGSAAPIFWGLLLIGAGFLLLTVTIGMLPTPSAGAVGIAFALAGIALLAAFVVLHAHWWTLIAGPTSLGLGAVILLPVEGNGAIFLAGIGLGFAFVALTDVHRWWAVIPAGTLLTLALIALLNGTAGAAFAGALLFAGLAATFGVLTVIKVGDHAMRWPIYPAAACVVLAVIVASGQLGAFVWPILLIAAGALLLLRAGGRRV